MRAAIFAFILAAVLPALAEPAAAPLPQGETPAAVEAGGPGEGSLAVDQAYLDRIRRELARPDTLRAQFGDDGRVVFRVEVEGQLPRFADFIGRDESLVGTTPFGSMTHSDFVSMVTPPQARSFGAFTNGDLLQVLGTSLAAAFAINGAVRTADAFKSWWSGREVKSAREEIKVVVDAAAERQRIEEAARQRAAEAEADRLAAIEAERKALAAPREPGRAGREPDLGPSIAPAPEKDTASGVSKTASPTSPSGAPPKAAPTTTDPKSMDPGPR